MTQVFTALGIFFAAFGILALLSWFCGKATDTGDDRIGAWFVSTFFSAIFITLMFIYYHF